jgi:general secretion pathway protein G
LVELVVAFTILLILSTMAVPWARHQVRRHREAELLNNLREIRRAIDKYKDMCDAGRIAQNSPDENCYPPSLEALVNGVKLTNTLTGNNQTGKIRFLRHLPRDPMTADGDWGKRSMQDSPASDSWGGQNVFDVYSTSNDKGSNGVPYSHWF